MTDLIAFGERVITNLEKVIVGKRQSLEMVVVGLLCQGHVLIEDVPGVGKTILARSLAKSVGCAFNRIQFTPDMLPSDVTGISIYNQETHQFEFRPGPVIGQIVLADEINRATPKTQAALLEAMEERQVTIEGMTTRLPELFFVGRPALKPAQGRKAGKNQVQILMVLDKDISPKVLPSRNTPNSIRRQELCILFQSSE